MLVRYGCRNDSEVLKVSNMAAAYWGIIQLPITNLQLLGGVFKYFAPNAVHEEVNISLHWTRSFTQIKLLQHVKYHGENWGEAILL